ncbi:MAG: acetyl-CoA carboxylase carboxyltransferase subunit alpha [Anaerorhabdus sp.]
MNLKECEALIKSLEEEKAKIENPNSSYFIELNQQIKRIRKETYSNLSAWDRVCLARHIERPKAQDYIECLFDNLIEIHGDRFFGDDPSLYGAIGTFHDMPVTILAQTKGKNTKENIDRNFGMMQPEGYRKAIRLAKQAEKFNRPIITFVDTPGAFPGKGAEERGQAEAIAQCLYTFSDIKVPVICIVVGEGGSGGALALSVADCIVMLENAVYSILTPEGFATILWKDETMYEKASEVMELTSYDLKDKGIVDLLIKEPIGKTQECFEIVAQNLNIYIHQELVKLKKLKVKDLLEKRYQKFRKIGELHEK